MAISKRGLRTIIINEVKFYWKFNGELVIIKEGKKNSPLKVDFGWYDEWLFINDRENIPPEYDLKRVTPKFVREAIEFAISHEWGEKRMEIEYRNKAFMVKG